MSHERDKNRNGKRSKESLEKERKKERHTTHVYDRERRRITRAEHFNEAL